LILMLSTENNFPTNFDNILFLPQISLLNQKISPPKIIAFDCY
jgi:hypothetical protein